MSESELQKINNTEKKSSWIPHDHQKKYHTTRIISIPPKTKKGSGIWRLEIYLYVGFVFVAHISLQVESYIMNEQIKFTNKHIENGHFVMCVGTFVVSNHLFCHKYT